MNRATAWGDTGIGTRRRFAELPHAHAVFTALLGLLAVTESLAEFIAVHGSIPRMFADTASGAARDSNVAGVQFVLIVGLLCLSTALPLAFLRPLMGGVTVTVTSIGSLAIFDTLTVAGFAAQLIAQYRLARNGSLLPAMLLGAPFLGLALAAPGDGHYRTRVVLLAALAPAAAFAGLARRAGEHGREHNAVREVMAGTQWEYAARGERARIVRELHDVVGHHISMIAVQAETARVATAGMPAQGAERLLGIGDTARAALTEMRRLLGVLREDTESVTGGDRRPQPDLRRLNDLLDEARTASGTSIRLILSGFPRALDPGVELAAYRIAQESLTNARKHAPGAAVDVELHYGDDSLYLRVRDNGPGPPPDQTIGGHGLLGMRERAAATGGEVRTGATTAGGFQVEAHFPAPQLPPTAPDTRNSATPVPEAPDAGSESAAGRGAGDVGAVSTAVRDAADTGAVSSAGRGGPDAGAVSSAGRGGPDAGAESPDTRATADAGFESIATRDAPDAGSESAAPEAAPGGGTGPAARNAPGGIASADSGWSSPLHTSTEATTEESS